MSSREFFIWQKWREKVGPLNPIRFYDQPSAILAAQVNNAYGGKAKPIDFMPYSQDRTPEISGEEFISRLSRMKGVKIGR